MAETRTALIVDDEEQLLRLMARLLERAGFRARTAKSASAAREIFHEEATQLDVVILDVLMPDGEGAAKLLPEFSTTRPDLEIILVSGEALPAELESERSRSGAHFLQKPFSPKTFARLLEQKGFSSAASSGKPESVPVGSGTAATKPTISTTATPPTPQTGKF